jgi:hypothetical protein
MAGGYREMQKSVLAKGQSVTNDLYRRFCR